MPRKTGTCISKDILIVVAVLLSTPGTRALVQLSPKNIKIRESAKEFSTIFDRTPSELLLPAIKAAAAASLALILVTAEPTFAATSHTSTTAAQIHINKLPPTTVSVDIDDLPFIGGILSGTYRKIDDISSSSSSSSTSVVSSRPSPVIIKSPEDKVTAVKNAATGGHLEFDVDGVVQTHVNVDVAASNGVAAFRIESPLIPKLPFRNAASALIPPGVSALKLAHSSSTSHHNNNKLVESSSQLQQQQQHPTAAHISLNSLPPSAISVQIEDLPVLGKALSGVYTKVTDDIDDDLSSAVTIESPKDKVSAIKAIASTGHLEFDVDGVIQTHLDVDIATDTVGTATVRVASPLIPALPFQNAASF
ncbi:hypothetical protein IV203_013065 [Nitzschia inconspicua]|uniref:Uncharacterized protein n=1 Tax=Nitzschia inconspicua TaxID=303405 RepID=A0A9K3M587_9STRA|nr:hypothetical protein IV203_013065 [Nitzschia inconspicua]